MGSASVDIIEATALQHVALAAPLFDQYRVFYRQVSDPNTSYRFLFDRWASRESTLFLAMANAVEAVGFVHLYPSFLSDRMLRFWVLNDLYVIPDYRRQGVARSLMRRAEQLARETGSGGLTLSTAVDNLNAQALYESEGYVRDDKFLYYNRLLERSTSSPESH
jgi:GNAT superfamily N-acetyltransferase